MTTPPSEAVSDDALSAPRQRRRPLRLKQCVRVGCDVETVARTLNQRFFCSPECRIAVSSKLAEVKQLCAREGCRVFPPSLGDGHCSLICKAIDEELTRAQRLCQALGADAPMASKLWAETVALSDGWTEHLAMVSRLQATKDLTSVDSRRIPH